MSKSRVLFLDSHPRFRERDYMGFTVDARELFSDAVNSNRLLSLFARVIHYLNWYPMWSFYGDWQYDLNQYDLVIINEAISKPTDIRHLGDPKAGGSEHLILSYRNHIRARERRLHREAQRLQLFEVTYNLPDAERYGIHFAPNYVDSTILSQLEVSAVNAETKWDLIFLGLAKNPARYRQLMRIWNGARTLELRTNFWICSLLPVAGTRRERRPYAAYLQDAVHSKAILDVVVNSNAGFTLRPIEAVYMHRLLVTNYKDIVRYDYYEANKENIYILNDENIDGLPAFLEREYQLARYDVAQHDFGRWVERIAIQYRQENPLSSIDQYTNT